MNQTEHDAVVRMMPTFQKKAEKKIFEEGMFKYVDIYKFEKASASIIRHEHMAVPDKDEVGVTIYHYQMEELRTKGPVLCVRSGRENLKRSLLLGSDSATIAIRNILRIDLRYHLLKFGEKNICGRPEQSYEDNDLFYAKPKKLDRSALKNFLKEGYVIYCSHEVRHELYNSYFDICHEMDDQPLRAKKIARGKSLWIEPERTTQTAKGSSTKCNRRWRNGNYEIFFVLSWNKNIMQYNHLHEDKIEFNFIYPLDEIRDFASAYARIDTKVERAWCPLHPESIHVFAYKRRLTLRQHMTNIYDDFMEFAAKVISKHKGA